MEIKTKYNLGDKVWGLYENKPTEFIITKIEVYAYRYTRNTIWYIDMHDEGYTEEQVFSTKEELLKSL